MELPPPPGSSPTPSISPIEHLIRRHQDGVWRHLRWLGCSANAADDLTQETFLRMLRGPFEARGQGQTSAYLRRTARNVWREHRRAGRQDVDACGHGDAEAWAEAATRAFERSERDRDVRLAALRHCVDQLDDRKRLALDGFYRDRRSHDQLADSLGIKPGGVKILLQRVRAALRTCIDVRLATADQGDV